MASDASMVPFDGEVLVVWGRAGLRPLALAAIHRVGAPSGPVVELALAGLTPGIRGRPVRRLLATSARRTEPHGTLKWFAQDRLREVHWDEGALRLWAGVGGRGLPARVPTWALGGPSAEERGRLPTRAVVARVHIDAPTGGPLAPFTGRRHGILFSTARLVGELPWVRLPGSSRAEPAPEAY